MKQQRHKYTEEEKQFIIDSYKNMSVKQISEILNVSQQTIKSFINNRHITKGYKIKPFNWTKEKLNLLYENYNDLSRNELAKLIGCCITHLRTKIEEEIKLGNLKNKLFIWDEEKIQWLKHEYNKISVKDMAKHFNVCEETIKRKLIKLNLKPNKLIKDGSFNYYELEILKFYYNQIPNRDLCKLLPNKTWQQIKLKARRLGLNKGNMTYPEELVELLLEKYNYQYKKQVKLEVKEKYYIADFIVNNIVIEVNGDYWHGNPLIYKQLNDLQKSMVKRDKEKALALKETYNYETVYIWENDLIYNYDKCEKVIQMLRFKTNL